MDKEHTIKQAKFIKLLLENLGTKGSSKSLGEIILEAGYSEAMAKNPYQILESKTIQKGLKPFIDKLDERRKSALNHITDKKLKASAGRDLAYIMDTLTKNHQLIGGGATERIGITKEDKEAIDRAFKGF